MQTITLQDTRVEYIGKLNFWNWKELTHQVILSRNKFKNYKTQGAGMKPVPCVFYETSFNQDNSVRCDTLSVTGESESLFGCCFHVNTVIRYIES